MSTYDNQPPLDGWAPVVHRDSPLTPAAEPSVLPTIELGEN